MDDSDSTAGVIPFAFPGVPGVRCLFTTAPAGDMSLDPNGEDPVQARENRRRLMRRAGFSRWAEVRQVHGDGMVQAEGDSGVDNPGLANADGQYCFAKNVGLVVKTADCQPILLARADGGAVAALHVGWRGNAMNFPGTAVERLCRAFACEPGDLVAVRGPSLGPTASEFVNFVSEWPSEFSPWFEPEHKTVNLWALTRSQLQQAGLRRDRIFSLDLCTKTMAGHLFSYRRGDKGRQISVIWRES